MIQKIIETTEYVQSRGIDSAEVGVVFGTFEYF